MRSVLDIHISREEAIKLLLTSIALEELALANILNAHAENIQYVLSMSPTAEELIRINNIGVKLLRNVARNQMLLQFKLEVLQNYLDNYKNTNTYKVQ